MTRLASLPGGRAGLGLRAGRSAAARRARGSAIGGGTSACGGGRANGCGTAARLRTGGAGGLTRRDSNLHVVACASRFGVEEKRKEHADDQHQRGGADETAPRLAF